MIYNVTFIDNFIAYKGREFQSYYNNSINDTFSKIFLEKFERDPIKLFRYDNRFI